MLVWQYYRHVKYLKLAKSDLRMITLAFAVIGSLNSFVHYAIMNKDW